MLVNKGINIVEGLAGSSYLLEIDKLSMKHLYTVIVLDNNHQIDALYKEINNIYSNKNILKFPENQKIVLYKL